MQSLQTLRAFHKTEKHAPNNCVREVDIVITVTERDPSTLSQFAVH